MTPSRVEILIDELVLHDFAPGDRHAIAAALETELARLIGKQGAPAVFSQAVDVDQLVGGAFTMTPGAPAAVVGVQVAQGIVEGVQP